MRLSIYCRVRYEGRICIPPHRSRRSNPNAQFSLMQRRATIGTIEPKRKRGARVGRERREVERFESLVGELSAAMARAPADAVDREIDSWLGKICQALDLDRSAVYERDAPGEPVRTTHTWRRANSPPFPRHYDPGKLF